MRLETNYKAIAEKAVRQAQWECRAIKRNKLLEELRAIKPRIKAYGDKVVFTDSEYRLIRENAQSGYLNIPELEIYSLPYSVVLDED